MFVICLDWLLPINSIVPPSDGNKVLGRTALNRQFTCTFILRHAHATHHCTASWALTSRSHPYLQKRRRLFSSTLRHSHEYFLLGSEVSCDAPTFLWHSIACQRQTIWLCILLFFLTAKIVKITYNSPLIISKLFLNSLFLRLNDWKNAKNALTDYSHKKMKLYFCTSILK